MGAAAYRRGSRAISKETDRTVQASGVHARSERRALADERAGLLSQIADLEKKLARSERARTILRGQLSEERRAHAEEKEAQERAYRFAVRTLAKRARLDT